MMDTKPKLSVAMGALVLFAVALTPSHAFVPPSLRTQGRVAATTSTPFTVVGRSPVATTATTTTTTTTSLRMSDTSAASSQNLFGVLSDATTGAIFSLLHAFDDCGIEDSSKNLRVLWVRALLNYRGQIDDPIAKTFLPPTTRGLVTSEFGASLLDPILKFAEWIQARTEFIDTSLGHFLSSPVCNNDEDGSPRECNVVLFGAGYDTRALRYRHAHGGRINFIEVDLPSVVEGKRKLYQKFQREQDPDWDPSKTTTIPFDLNDCGGDDAKSLIGTLREQGGLKENVPTFLVWEAVLFYVNEDAVRNIMDELFAFARTGGNGDDPSAETLLCFTDSLKPFVDVPFSNEARIFFNENGLDLLQHRARWGGAVHFALAASKGSSQTAPPESAETKQAAGGPVQTGGAGGGGTESVSNSKQHITSRIGIHVQDREGGLVNSYIPTASRNAAILEKPSFDNTWYAVAFPWQIDGYESPLDAVLKRKSGETKPFAMRLWGEPLVVYRDSNGELVAMNDVCPHRSAPLSMGKIQDGELSCMYHGWKFGAGGECVDIPTLHTVDDEGVDTTRDSSRILSGVTKANCGNLRAVVEHEGLVYIWRGNVLEADLSLLPTRRKGDMETVPVDTVLDYSVDYSYIVENNLDSPHLFYLHDGSVPPIESIGMLNKNLPKLKLTAFTDDCGMGHLGKLGAGGRPKKLLRFDPPNVVRHGGVSGFEEEFHIIPVAPQRTRVLLRQHLPRGPILSTVTGIPGLMPLLTLIVNNWNYHIGLEDACIMQGQASRIEDWGSPRLAVGGLGDDLIKRYWRWRSKAHEDLKQKGQDSPYVFEFAQSESLVNAIPTGTAFGDDPEIVGKVRSDSRLRNSPLVTDNQEVDPDTGRDIGTYGILSNYVQNTPAAMFPPVNYKQYAKLLVFDQFVKNLLKDDDCAEEAATPVMERKLAPIE